MPPERRQEPTVVDTVSLVLHRQDMLSTKLDSVEEQVIRTCVKLDILQDVVEKQSAWQINHDRVANELLTLKDDIKNLVEAAKWLRISRRVVALIGGSVIALFLFYDTILHGLENFRGP